MKRQMAGPLEALVPGAEFWFVGRYRHLLRNVPGGRQILLATLVTATVGAANGVKPEPCFNGRLYVVEVRSSTGDEVSIEATPEMPGLTLCGHRLYPLPR